jgi:hypothetical protein
MGRYFVTTAIPYVNGRPHVGHALEIIQTDVLARHRRQRGDEVRFQTGTDDNALKNVQSAEAEGITPQEYVDRVATRFGTLRDSLNLSYDDFIKASSDPWHQPGVDKLWAACAERGDFYRKTYSGLGELPSVLGESRHDDEMSAFAAVDGELVAHRRASRPPSAASAVSASASRGPSRSPVSRA